MTNLHIFFSLSYSFVLVAGWWMSCTRRYALREGQMLVHFVRNVVILWLCKPGTFGLPNQMLRDTGTDVFKNPWTIPEKPGRMGFVVMTYKNVMNPAKTKNISEPVLSNQFGGADSKRTRASSIKTVERRRPCRPYFLSGVSWTARIPQLLYG